MTLGELNDIGEEFVQRLAWKPSGLSATTITVGLYRPSVNDLSDSDDLDAITTEPDTGNYSRQTVTIDSSDFSFSEESGSYSADLKDIVFDVTNTTDDVGGYFLVANFQSDRAGDGSQTDHLIGAGDLTNTGHLDGISEFLLTDARILLE